MFEFRPRHQVDRLTTMMWRRAAGRIVVALFVCSGATTAMAIEPDAVVEAQEAWWTGPMLASSPEPLPQHHWLIEPYFFRAVADARFDATGDRQSAPRSDRLATRTYVLWGATDRLTLGIIPRISLSSSSTTARSEGFELGDVQLQARYRLTTAALHHGSLTTSLGLTENLPIGRYDRLGARTSDGTSSGAWATTLSLYAQASLAPPRRRPYRVRLEIDFTRSPSVPLSGASVYGTTGTFRGRAFPGNTVTLDVAGEWSVTRRWVLALDLVYQHAANTRVVARDVIPALAVPNATSNGGSSDLTSVAPAIECNISANFGLLAGVIVNVRGRNAADARLPVLAINWYH